MGASVNGASFRIIVTSVRAWTWFYTLPLDAVEREDRRREIESDLWEFEDDQKGQPGLTAASHILVRALLGVPDDLLWACEHLTIRSFTVGMSTVLRLAVVAIGAATVVVSA